MSTQLSVAFYRTPGGREPVSDWLDDLPDDDRTRVTTDIRSIEFGWPVGMPDCRPMGHGLWEVRSRISDGRITRIMFFVDDGIMYLLHAFIKKTQATPKDDLDLAIRRMHGIKRGL